MIGLSWRPPQFSRLCSRARGLRFFSAASRLNAAEPSSSASLSKFRSHPASVSAAPSSQPLLVRPAKVGPVAETLLRRANAHQAIPPGAEGSRLGVAAMTVDDAKKIAHGLNELSAPISVSWTCRVFTAL